MSSEEEAESGSDYEDEMEHDMDAEMEGEPEPTGGYTSAGTSGDEEDCDDYFGDDMTPMRMLEMLNAQQPEVGKQPFQIAKEQRRARRHARAAAEDSEEEEEGQQEQQQDAEASAAAGKLLKRKGRRRRGRWRGTKGIQAIPDHVEKMMGQANLLYATQEHEKAIDILMEVIRVAPNVKDPYYTLAEMHLDMGDKRKALSFYMIGAQISVKRAHEAGIYQKMAELSMDLGYLHQAITCWQIALRRHRNDPGILAQRAEAFVALGEVARAIQEYKRLLQQAPTDPDVVRRLVQLYHGQGDVGAGIRLMEDFMREHSAHTNLTLVNMLAELYITRGDFNLAHKLIQRAEEVLCVDTPLPIDLVIKQGTCLVHTGHVVDGLSEWAKLLEFDPVTEGGDDFSDLYMAVVHVCASLALYEAALPFVTALVETPGLEPSPEDLALYSSCYRQAGRPNQAKGLYEKRLMDIGVHHPSYLEIALSYVDLLAGTGQRHVAVNLLEQIDTALEGHQLTLSEDRAEQVELKLRKVQLHLTLGNRNKFLEEALPLLTEALDVGEQTAAQLSKAAEAQHKGEIPKDILKALQRRRAFARKGGRRGAAAAAPEPAAVFKGYTARDRRKPHVVAADEEAARLLAAGAASGPVGALAEVEGQGDASGDLLGSDALFEAFLVTVQALVAAGRLEQARDLLSRATDLVNARLALVKLSKLSKLKEGDKAALQARRDGLKLLECYVWVEAGDKARALKELKPLLKRWTCSWAVWGLFAALAPSQLPSRQWLRDVASTATKHPHSAALALLATHGALLGEQYHDATSGYAALLSVLPNEPLLLLCLAAAQLDLAVSHRVTAVDRNTAALRGFAALHSYAAQRHNKIEAAYNLGRAAQLLGLGHVAVAYYESVLQQAEVSMVKEPSPGAAARTLGMSLVAVGRSSQQSSTLGGSGYSLVREAAWNLSLLYKSSGADHMARQLLRRYLTY